MGALKAIAFDKTGTLTKGVPVVTDFNVLNKQVNDKELLSIITALEYRSQHPLASAIMKKAEEENITYSDVQVENFSSITGKGIKGIVNGTTYYIGSPKLFKELLTTDFDKDLEQNVTTLQNQGKTAMIIGTEKKYWQLLQLLMKFVNQVRKLFKSYINLESKTIMLTGDNKGTANAIGGQVGVSDIEAELMPQDKLDFIKQLRSEYGNVAMVGDGVNDAPALAASTVGIAMGGAGTDTALKRQTSL